MQFFLSSFKLIILQISYFYRNFDTKTVSAIKYLRFTKRYKDDRKILKEKKKRKKERKKEKQDFAIC